MRQGDSTGDDRSHYRGANACRASFKRGIVPANKPQEVVFARPIVLDVKNEPIRPMRTETRLRRILTHQRQECRLISVAAPTKSTHCEVKDVLSRGRVPRGQADYPHERLQTLTNPLAFASFFFSEFRAKVICHFVNHRESGSPHLRFAH